MRLWNPLLMLICQKHYNDESREFPINPFLPPLKKTDHSAADLRQYILKENVIYVGKVMVLYLIISFFGLEKITQVVEE